MWVTRTVPAASRQHRFEQPLGPLAVTIRAPRDVVYAVISAPYLGKTPRAMAEEYVLEDSAEGGTSFLYRSVLGSDLPALGGWWAGRNARAWNAAVRHSVRQITAEAERRAGRR